MKPSNIPAAPKRETAQSKAALAVLEVMFGYYEYKRRCRWKRRWHAPRERTRRG